MIETIVFFTIQSFYTRSLFNFLKFQLLKLWKVYTDLQ